MKTQVLTSAPCALNKSVVSAYINKKTAQVISVSYDDDAHVEKSDLYFESNIWTFSQNYPSPEKPQGYNGDTDDFDEALSYVLGFSQATYKKTIAQIRSQHPDMASFFKRIGYIASEKEIWLRPVSVYVTDRGNSVFGLGVLPGSTCIGFAWNCYEGIDDYLWGKGYWSDQEWLNNVNYELAEFSHYINCDFYAIDYIAKDSEEREEQGHLIYDNNYSFDPNNKEKVLAAAFAAFDLPDSPDDWVKAEQQAIFVAQC